MHFRRVVATDASAEQIRHAAPHPFVDYRIAPAEASGLADCSVDLVAVAQAAHWFHLPRFHAEAARVLTPGGIVALWGYGRMVLPGRNRRPLLAAGTRADRRRHRSLDFPFTEIQRHLLRSKSSGPCHGCWTISPPGLR